MNLKGDISRNEGDPSPGELQCRHCVLAGNALWCLVAISMLIVQMPSLHDQMSSLIIKVVFSI